LVGVSLTFTIKRLILPREQEQHLLSARSE
jgi:hypothetical protein